MDLEYPEDFCSSEDRHLSTERRISDSEEVRLRLLRVLYLSSA